MTTTGAPDQLTTGPAAAGRLGEHLAFAVDEISRWMAEFGVPAARLAAGRPARLSAGRRLSPAAPSQRQEPNP